MKGGGLQNMAPNAKRSFVLTLLFSAIAVATYLFAIVPAETDLAKERKNLEQLDMQKRRMDLDLRNASNARTSLENLNADLMPFRNAFLTRLLESYSMRAKSIIDPLALGAGLLDIDYTEEPFRALPLPSGPLPRQLHTRAVIKMTAVGSYQAAISFLLRLEKELPLVSVQSLSIALRQNSRTEQSITFLLEWPAKGAVTRK